MADLDSEQFPKPATAVSARTQLTRSRSMVGKVTFKNSSFGSGFNGPMVSDTQGSFSARKRSVLNENTSEASTCGSDVLGSCQVPLMQKKISNCLSSPRRRPLPCPDSISSSKTCPHETICPPTTRLGRAGGISTGRGAATLHRRVSQQPASPSSDSLSLREPAGSPNVRWGSPEASLQIRRSTVAVASGARLSVGFKHSARAALEANSPTGSEASSLEPKSAPTKAARADQTLLAFGRRSERSSLQVRHISGDTRARGIADASSDRGAAQCRLPRIPGGKSAVAVPMSPAAGRLAAQEPVGPGGRLIVESAKSSGYCGTRLALRAPHALPVDSRGCKTMTGGDAPLDCHQKRKSLHYEKTLHFQPESCAKESTSTSCPSVPNVRGVIGLPAIRRPRDCTSPISDPVQIPKAPPPEERSSDIPSLSAVSSSHNWKMSVVQTSQRESRTLTRTEAARVNEGLGGRAVLRAAAPSVAAPGVSSRRLGGNSDARARGAGEQASSSQIFTRRRHAPAAATGGSISVSTDAVTTTSLRTRSPSLVSDCGPYRCVSLKPSGAPKTTRNSTGYLSPAPVVAPSRNDSAANRTWGAPWRPAQPSGGVGRTWSRKQSLQKTQPTSSWDAEQSGGGSSDDQHYQRRAGDFPVAASHAATPRGYTKHEQRLVERPLPASPQSTGLRPTSRVAILNHPCGGTTFSGRHNEAPRRLSFLIGDRSRATSLRPRLAATATESGTANLLVGQSSGRMHSREPTAASRINTKSCNRGSVEDDTDCGSGLLLHQRRSSQTRPDSRAFSPGFRMAPPQTQPLMGVERPISPAMRLSVSRKFVYDVLAHSGSSPSKETIVLPHGISLAQEDHTSVEESLVRSDSSSSGRNSTITSQRTRKRKLAGHRRQPPLSLATLERDTETEVRGFSPRPQEPPRRLLSVSSDASTRESTYSLDLLVTAPTSTLPVPAASPQAWPEPSIAQRPAERRPRRSSATAPPSFSSAASAVLSSSTSSFNSLQTALQSEAPSETVSSPFTASSSSLSCVDLEVSALSEDVGNMTARRRRSNRLSGTWSWSRIRESGWHCPSTVDRIEQTQSNTNRAMGEADADASLTDTRCSHLSDPASLARRNSFQSNDSLLEATSALGPWISPVAKVISCVERVAAPKTGGCPPQSFSNCYCTKGRSNDSGSNTSNCSTFVSTTSDTAVVVDGHHSNISLRAVAPSSAGNDLLLSEDNGINASPSGYDATSFPARFELLKRHPLGNGTHGSVFKAVSRTSPNIERAVKIVPRKRIKDLRQFESAITIVAKADHPNILKLFATYRDAERIFLVLELCSGGELFERVAEQGRLHESTAAKIIRQVFSAVDYCHQRGIAHRNLNLENFIFLSMDENAPVKLVGFGLAKREVEGLHTKAGSPYYTAPEVFAGSSYQRKCDLWSVGVVLFILLCGYPPFGDSTSPELLRRISSGRFSFPIHSGGRRCVSEDAEDLVRSLLQVDPAVRPSAAEALQHPWIQQLTATPPPCKLHENHLLCIEFRSRVDEISRRFFHSLSKFERAVLTLVAKNVPEHYASPCREFLLGGSCGAWLDRTGELWNAIGSPAYSEWIAIMLFSSRENLDRCRCAVREAFDTLDIDGDEMLYPGDLLSLQQNHAANPASSPASVTAFLPPLLEGAEKLFKNNQGVQLSHFWSLLEDTVAKLGGGGKKQLSIPT